MAHRIHVETDDCMSSGKCIADFPSAFDFDDDELAVLINDGKALSDQEMIRAARNCPSQAVRVFDENGEQLAT